jgi:hypothetical protein
MYPHRIRLRGPWECEPLARTGGDARPVPQPRRITLPGRWADGDLANFRGGLLFRRRFGYPGRIDDYERVWLTFHNAMAGLQIRLNGECLGKSSGAGLDEIEVTALLQDRNELTLEVNNPESCTLWDEVALEVRCAAYLRVVVCQATVCDDGSVGVFALGEVKGASAEALDLYLLLDRSTAAYAQLPAPVGPQAFCLKSDKLPLERWDASLDTPHLARIDLVHTATVWYTWEKEITLEPPHVRRD